MKREVVGAIVLLIAICAALWWYGRMKIESINSFEECAAAGYPIMESYPEQCRTPDGRNFVRTVEE